MSGITEHLMQLGLSEYEAKAYIATVVLGEGTIKEISDESKVPRSRAYDVMVRLLEKGLVELGNTNPRCYRANDPAEVFGHLIEDMEKARDEVVKALEELGSTAERRDNPIWTIKGEWAIDHKVAEMMESAKREVVIISIHNDYLRRYAKIVAAVSEKRPVTVVILEGSGDFIGMLGWSRLLCISEGKLSPPEPFISNAMESLDKGTEYDVELIMVCDREVSVILSKERSGHRAIISSGTVVDYFINRMMDLTIMEAKECGQSR
ncbi:MAG TPA: helix-turn-helix domain-containing protein [Methanomassiliicoccales archaeon]|jgi:predicted transcriptional regulator|nr:helix-turn-helix domain-containing protein [Methanomassiliicoccales archaeon]